MWCGHFVLIVLILNLNVFRSMHIYSLKLQCNTSPWTALTFLDSLDSWHDVFCGVLLVYFRLFPLGGLVDVVLLWVMSKKIVIFLKEDLNINTFAKCWSPCLCARGWRAAAACPCRCWICWTSWTGAEYTQYPQYLSIPSLVTFKILKINQ